MMNPGSDHSRDPAVPTDADSVGRWAVAFQQLFDPHPSHVALLTMDGTVLAVNAAWRAYGRANGLQTGYESVGQNYLSVCEAGVAAEYPGAREAYVGLLDVLRNGRPKFTVTYACHTTEQREWYRMWVEPQTPSVSAVIVAHQLVSSKPWQADDVMGSGPSAGDPAAGGFDAAADPFGWRGPRTGAGRSVYSAAVGGPRGLPHGADRRPS